jgi:hypothetical protein
VATEAQLARLVALPTPEDGVRRAWEVSLMDNAPDEHGNPTGFISFVDAETGRIWQRENRVEHFAQGPGAPTASQVSMNAAMPATRRAVDAAGPLGSLRVDRLPGQSAVRPRREHLRRPHRHPRPVVLGQPDRPAELRPSSMMNPASPVPLGLDRRPAELHDRRQQRIHVLCPRPASSTPDTAANRPVSPTRKFDFPWENSWNKSSCNPANFGTVVDGPQRRGRRDTNLFVMHNRMHDWSYYLGSPRRTSTCSRQLRQGRRQGRPRARLLAGRPAHLQRP